jgi:hypothetical protein
MKTSNANLSKALRESADSGDSCRSVSDQMRQAADRLDHMHAALLVAARSVEGRDSGVINAALFPELQGETK